MNGDQLMHSLFLQSLSSWSIAMELDKIFYHVAQPLHFLKAEGMCFHFNNFQQMYNPKYFLIYNYFDSTFILNNFIII